MIFPTISSEIIIFCNQTLMVDNRKPVDLLHGCVQGKGTDKHSTFQFMYVQMMSSERWNLL